MSGSPVRVALVDDDDAVLDSAQFLLEIEGHAVSSFPSGAAFLDTQAVQPFEKALQAAPPEKQAAVHRAAALNLAELGMTQQAELHFRDAVRLYRPPPGAPQPDPRLDYGGFLIRQGRTQSALEMLHQSVSASPTSPRAKSATSSSP